MGQAECMSDYIDWRSCLIEPCPPDPTVPFGNAWVASRLGEFALSSKSSQDAVAAMCNK